jgi:hypothetical protein
MFSFKNVQFQQELCRDIWLNNKKEAILLPNALIGETGVWKKMTELTITITRFRQFATECVTGDTLSSII